MMSSLLFLAAFLAFLWWIRREPPDFVLSVRDGDVEVIAGRPPLRVLHRVQTIVAEGGVARARIAAWRDQGAWTFKASGLDELTLRQIRYAVRYPDR